MLHANTQQRVAHIYNPENQTRQELIDGFVIRTKPFQRIYRSISTTTLEEPPQHFLIEGQRGSGKTSLMLRIRYELQTEGGIDHLIPVQLPEEQYGIFDLCRLWENVADYLHNEPGFEDLDTRIDELADREDYPTLCYGVLDEFLVANKKRLVLFIDNFGDMLDRFSDIELKRLRDIFHTSKHIQLVAASAQTLEYTYKYEQPFFEFFKIVRLKNLSKPEAVALLGQLAVRYGAEKEIDRIVELEPERIETIRILTGGVPRTIVLLFEIFLDKSGDVFQDLETLLDRVTPLYKHRMDDLKPQQQAIIDVIALSWDGIGTGEIVKRLKGRRFDNKKVSAQLAALTRNDLVSSRTIGKKDKIYFIRERFFNIWYLMRLGRRKNGDRVLWLVKFFQEWYSPKELVDRTRRHIDLACKGDLNTTGAYFMAEALSRTVSDMELQHELLQETHKFLLDKDRHLAESLSISDKSQLEMAAGKGDVNAMFELGYLYDNELEDFDKAVTYYKMAVKMGYVDAMNNLGVLYGKELKDFKKAVTYFQMAVNKNNVTAMLNLGYLYKNKLKDLDKAVAYYQMAIDKEENTRAMTKLGLLYTNELKNFDKAITCYQMAVDKGDVDAMFNLGYLYHNKLKEFNKAVTYYQLAVDKGHADAMNNLGVLYSDELKDLNKAIICYQMAVDKEHAGAMNNLGALYHTELKDFDKAVSYYQIAVDKGEACAMNNLGALYDNELKNFDKSVTYYQMAVNKGEASAMNTLAWLYFQQNRIEQQNTALELIQQALAKDNDPEYRDTLANLLLWQKNYDGADQVVRELLSENGYKDMIGVLTEYFIFLIAQEQLHAAHKLFLDFPNLQDKIKPVYYSLMTLLKDEYPKEHLRMGEELETTVEEILNKVKEMREKYGE